MIQQQISQDFLSAYRTKRELEISTLRMLKSAIANKQIENRMPKEDVLSDEEVAIVIKSEVKKRRDSAQSYEAGGRKDLAEKEKAEIAILEKYLPQQMEEDEIRGLIERVIKGMGMINPSDFGKIMKAVMAESGGAADGQTVSKILKEELNKSL